MKKKTLFIAFLLLVMTNSIINAFFVSNLKSQLKENDKEVLNLQQLNNELECKVEDLESAEPIVIEVEKNIYDERYYYTAQLMMELIEPIKEYDKLEYFAKYKTILSEYGDGLDLPETVYDYFTEEQIKVMQKCIETEAYDCPFEAKVGVACVILNRVEHEMFPTDPIEVIKKPNQFVYGRSNITETTKLALEYAFEVEDTTNGCIAFRSDKNPSVWNKWKYSHTDGYHYFYYIEEGDE